MAILTHPKNWRKPAAPSKRPPELSEDEQVAVRRALLFLRVQAGSNRKLAIALGVRPWALSRALWKAGKPSALLALRAARLAKVSVEALLGGEYPPEGACAHCGR
jgi:hypothetical protein